MGKPTITPAELRAEIDRLKQIMWDAYLVLGFDTDGDATYRAVVGWPDAPCSFLDACREFRRDYDESCESASFGARIAEAADVLDGLAHMVAAAGSNWWLARAGADGFDLDDCETELSYWVREYQFEKARRAVEIENATRIAEKEKPA